MGQPIGSIFEGQEVQEECRQHSATPFMKGMMWVVIGSQPAQWQPIQLVECEGSRRWGRKSNCL